MLRVLQFAGCVLLAGGAAAIATAAADPASSAVTSNRTDNPPIEQVRPQAALNQAGGSAVRASATVSAERLQERADLLKTGEAALSRLEVTTALQAFDRAALILHAADTEIALVRCYMQAGQYRRALAFGAHTAGAHLDVVGGSALYAWLLHVGGQSAIAQRVLDEAQGRMPDNPVVNEAQRQLRSNKPLAAGPLLIPPARLAPYGSSDGLPATARMAGSGLLLANGKQALVPLVLLPRSGKLWLRNGMGQLAKTKLHKRLPVIGMALLQLDSALPLPENMWVATRDAFPGSVGFAVEYVNAPDTAPAWPVLRNGFMGGIAGHNGNERLLGIDMPAGPRGGPVFDASGRLVGLAINGKPGTPDRLVTASQLRNAVGAQLESPPISDTVPHLSLDQIYETSLKTTLQLIAAP